MTQSFLNRPIRCKIGDHSSGALKKFCGTDIRKHWLDSHGIDTVSGHALKENLFAPMDIRDWIEGICNISE